MANPNGAILDDDAEMETQRKQRFKAWAAGYRKKSLKPNADLESWYPKMSSPYPLKDSDES